MKAPVRGTGQPSERVNDQDDPPASCRWLHGALALIVALSLVATGLGYARLGWGSRALEGLSLVHWQSFGDGDFEPMQARITVMSGRQKDSGGEFEARRMRAADWQELPRFERLVTWQALTEAPLLGAGSVEWLWDAEGRPQARVFAPGTVSGAVLVEDRSTGRKWLFERKWELP